MEELHEHRRRPLRRSPRAGSQMAHGSLQDKSPLVPHTGPHTCHTRATHMSHTDPHTNKNAPKNKQTRKRKRVIPYSCFNDRLEGILWRLLDNCDAILRAYVYTILDDRKDDAVSIGPPFQDLIAWLRNEH